MLTLLKICACLLFHRLVFCFQAFWYWLCVYSRLPACSGSPTCPQRSLWCERRRRTSSYSRHTGRCSLEGGDLWERNRSWSQFSQSCGRLIGGQRRVHTSDGSRRRRPGLASCCSSLICRPERWHTGTWWAITALKYMTTFTRAALCSPWQASEGSPSSWRTPGLLVWSGLWSFPASCHVRARTEKFTLEPVNVTDWVIYGLPVVEQVALNAFCLLLWPFVVFWRFLNQKGHLFVDLKRQICCLNFMSQLQTNWKYRLSNLNGTWTLTGRELRSPTW